MPSRSLTDEEKRDNKIKNQTKKYMNSVRAFLAKKNGEVAPEWECSLMLLEEYYKQFVTLTEEINGLTRLVVNSRYGAVPHPLLAARDKAAIRLESMMKSCGITFKEAARMELVEPMAEESVLESYVKNKIEKR